MPLPHIVEQQMVNELKQLQVEALGESDEVRRQLHLFMDAAAYYIEIYHHSLDEVLGRSGRSPEESTIVDFGGGFGFLSILAKRLGFSKVIYISSDAENLQVAQQAGVHMQTGADIYLQGDMETLRCWCASQGVQPNALLSMNEIGRIYVLDQFFAAAHALSHQMTMLFTTVASPYNKRLVRKLHHAMQVDEQGYRNRKGFWQMRRDYVQSLHPDMPQRQLDYWATQTRGLNYEDIERAVESQSPNLLLDSYNTCNPATGRWSQRLLPIDDYRQLLAPYGYGVLLLPGHCNEHHRGPARWASRHHNDIISQAPRTEPTRWREHRRMLKALKVAPFIYLIVTSK